MSFLSGFIGAELTGVSDALVNGFNVNLEIAGLCGLVAAVRTGKPDPFMYCLHMSYQILLGLELLGALITVISDSLVNVIDVSLQEVLPFACEITSVTQEHFPWSIGCLYFPFFFHFDYFVSILNFFTSVAVSYNVNGLLISLVFPHVSDLLHHQYFP